MGSCQPRWVVITAQLKAECMADASKFELIMLTQQIWLMGAAAQAQILVRTTRIRKNCFLQRLVGDCMLASWEAEANVA